MACVLVLVLEVHPKDVHGTPRLEPKGAPLVVFNQVLLPLQPPAEADWPSVIVMAPPSKIQGVIPLKAPTPHSRKSRR